MTEFRQKLNNIQSSTNFVDGRLFLVDAINDIAGFLLGGEKLYFVIKNSGFLFGDKNDKNKRKKEENCCCYNKYNFLIYNFFQ